MSEASVTDLLDAELRRLRHRMEMIGAMAMTTAVLGVPYGPALCETRPSRMCRLR